MTKPHRVFRLKNEHMQVETWERCGEEEWHNLKKEERKRVMVGNSPFPIPVRKVPQTPSWRLTGWVECSEEEFFSQEPENRGIVGLGGTDLNTTFLRRANAE